VIFPQKNAQSQGNVPSESVNHSNGGYAVYS